jgi:hypothetical protein
MRGRAPQNFSSGHRRISKRIVRIAAHPTPMMSQNMGRDQAVHKSKGVNKAIRPQTVMAMFRITLTTSLAVQEHFRS